MKYLALFVAELIILTTFYCGYFFGHSAGFSDCKQIINAEVYGK